MRREDGSYLVDGALGTDDLRELFGLNQLPNEEDHDFRYRRRHGHGPVRPYPTGRRIVPLA